MAYLRVMPVSSLNAGIGSWFPREPAIPRKQLPQMRYRRAMKHQICRDSSPAPSLEAVSAISSAPVRASTGNFPSTLRELGHSQAGLLEFLLDQLLGAALLRASARPRGPRAEPDRRRCSTRRLSRSRKACFEKLAAPGFPALARSSCRGIPGSSGFSRWYVSTAGAMRRCNSPRMAEANDQRLLGDDSQPPLLPAQRSCRIARFRSRASLCARRFLPAARPFGAASTMARNTSSRLPCSSVFR